MGQTNKRRLINLLPDDTGAPTNERLYRRIRSLILSGALPHGSGLASSRTLAKHLRISRNSVLAAFDRLIADGWLASRRSSGIYVTYAGGAISRVPAKLAGDVTPKPFALGTRALDVFPAQLWNRLQSRRWKRITSANLQLGDAQGWTPLREAIATHVALTRGLDCSPDEVIVTTSVPAAVDLAVRALGLAGTEAWTEEPGYHASRQALLNNAVQLIPVGVDAAGLDVDFGERVSPCAKVALVTPACQFPTCAVMGKRRRARLLRWALARDAWIFEDDYDWQSSSGVAIPKPIAAEDRSRVVYINSFNPTLFPALRIAYMICPAALIDRFAAIRVGLDEYSNVPNQMVMADFIEGGHLDEHLRRLSHAYVERRAALIRSLQLELSDVMTAQENSVGTHVVAMLHDSVESAVIARCADAGVSLDGMRQFRLIGTEVEQVLFGYAGFPVAAISSAVRAIRSAMGRG